jgi:hypothetical protein
MLVKLLVRLDAPGGPTGEYVALTDAEIAQRSVDDLAARATDAAALTRALGGLVAKCDRYLAQTDWIALPASARPVDMAAALASEVDANINAWIAWRQQVRDLRRAAATGKADISAPFPVQPDVPAVVLS